MAELMNAVQITTVLQQDAGHQQHSGVGYENTVHPTTPCDHAELFGNKHRNNESVNTISSNRMIQLLLKHDNDNSK